VSSQKTIGAAAGSLPHHTRTIAEQIAHSAVSAVCAAMLLPDPTNCPASATVLIEKDL